MQGTSLASRWTLSASAVPDVAVCAQVERSTLDSDQGSRVFFEDHCFRLNWETRVSNPYFCVSGEQLRLLLGSAERLGEKLLAQ